MILMIVSLPVHICDHDTRRRYGYGDRIGQMIHVYATRRKLKLETAYNPQRQILRMRANPACMCKSA
jgi:hypothetical protein